MAIMRGHRAIAPYAAALAVVAAGVAVRLPFTAWLHHHAPFLTIYPAVMVAAVLWGKRPGIVAGLAGFFAADLLFVDPNLQFHATPPSLLSLIAIVATAVYVGHIGERLRSTRDAARSAANALAESEQRQQRLMSVLPTAVYTCDAEGRITFFNEQAAEIWGCQPQLGDEDRRLCGTLRLALPSGESLPYDQTPMAAAIREGRAFRNQEAIVERPDGRRVHVLANVDPMRNAEGQIVGAVNAFSDVTDQKEAEESLRRRAEEVERILDIVPAAVWVAHDPQCQTITGNRRANVFYEASRGENVSASTDPEVRRFFTPEGRELPPGELPMQLAAATNQEVRDAELHVQLPSGRRIVMLGGAVPLRNESGEARGCIGAFLDITRLKLAEEALLESEQHARRIIDNTLAFVGVMALDGTLLEANATALRAGGIAREEAVGRKFWDCSWWSYDPDVQQQLREAVDRAGGGELVHYDVVVRMAGDSRMPIDFMLAPVRDSAGQVAYLIPSGIDITKRKQAEKTLRESESFYRQTIDSIPGMVFTTRPDGYCDYQSQQWVDYTGVPLSEHLGDGWNKLLHPDDRPRAFAAWRAAVEGRAPYDLEYRVRRHDGEYEWFKVTGRPIRGASGQILRWFGTALNIHHLIEAQAAQRESERQLALAITESKRAEERMRLLSEVAARLLASEQPQEIVESLCRKVMAHLDCHAFFNFLVDEEAGRLRLNACAGIPNEDAREIEWLDYGVAVCGCAARDGCRIVAERIQTTDDPRTDLVRSFGIQAYACHPLMDQGKVIGTLSFGSRTKTAFTDDDLSLMRVVADQVAVAMQKIRLMHSLENQVEAAEAANVAKSQFLANMSHELRTPMNAILGMIDVALPKAIDLAVQDCLKTAKGSADLLLTLLNDLLDSAKIESGKLELESAPFSLRRILNHLTQVLSVRTSEKGLIFSCHIPDDMPDALVGDRLRLQQVLLNLANNAVKFTECGEVEIRLRACPLPHAREESVELEFAVRDTGIGISSSKLEHLFQRFSQADPSVTRRFGGTGLGLSICKDLVEMMGGRIWVESEEGKGSIFRFTVRLPLAKELPEDFDALLPVLAAARCPLNVLLVEDNPANQKLATYVLRDRGHQVEIAGDGAAAVERTGQNRYDVVLMDVQMPGMDGLAATAAIRQRENGDGRVPIIAMTAHAMPGDRERCLEAGMDGYLSKPINAREMIALVESLAHRESPAIETALMAQSPASRSAVVFDREEALMRCSDDPEILQEMIQCYFDEVDLLFPQMRAALEKGDLTEVGRLGHRLKGTVVYLGAQPAKEAALRVEHFERSAGMPAEAQAAVDALWLACSALKSAILEEPPGGR